MRIEIDKRHFVEREPYGWALITIIDAVDRKTNQPKQSEVKTWPGTLENCMKSIIDRSPANAKTASDILSAIQAANLSVCEAVRNFDHAKGSGS